VGGTPTDVTSWEDVINEGTPLTFTKAGSGTNMLYNTDEFGYPRVQHQRGDYLSVGGLTVGIPFTVMYVGRLVENGSNNDFGRVMMGPADRVVGMLFAEANNFDKFFSAGDGAALTQSLTRLEKDNRNYNMYIGVYDPDNDERTLRWNSAPYVLPTDISPTSQTGSYTLGRGFQGSIVFHDAYVYALWNKALTAGEIAAVENWVYNEYGNAIARPEFFDTIYGLQYDFDLAKDAVVVSDEITQLTDQQSGVVITPFAGYPNPPYISDLGNGKPAMQGNGADLFLENVVIPDLPDSHSMFMVVKPEAQVYEGRASLGYVQGAGNALSELAVGDSTVIGNWTDHMKAVLPNLDPSLWPDYDTLFSVDNFLKFLEDAPLNSGINRTGFLVFPGVTGGLYPEFERLNFGESRIHTPFIPDGYTRNANGSARFPSNFVVFTGALVRDMSGSSSRPAIGFSINEVGDPLDHFNVYQVGDNGDELAMDVRILDGSITQIRTALVQSYTSWFSTGRANAIQGFYSQKIFSTSDRRSRMNVNWNSSSGTSIGSLVSPFDMTINNGVNGNFDVWVIWCGDKMYNNPNTAEVESRADEFRKFATQRNSSLNYTWSGYPWPHDPNNYPILSDPSGVLYTNVGEQARSVAVDKENVQVIAATTHVSLGSEISVNGEIQGAAGNASVITENRVRLGAGSFNAFVIGRNSIQRYLIYNRYVSGDDFTRVVDKLISEYSVPVISSSAGANLSVWYKSSQVILDGSGDIIGVHNLGNSSSNNLSLKASNPMTLVSNAVNGRPSILHNGVDQNFTTIGNLGITGSQARTVFVVAKAGVAGVFSVMFDMGVVGSGEQFSLRLDNPGDIVTIGVNGGNLSYDRGLTSEWKIYAIRFFDANMKDFYMFENGVLKLTSITAGTNVAINTADSILYVGSTITPSSYYDGEWAEIRIYNDDIGNSRFTEVYNQLASEYGITISQPMPVELIRAMYIGSGEYNGTTWTPLVGNDGATATSTPNQVVDAELGTTVMNLDGVSDYFDVNGLDNTMNPTDNVSVIALFRHLAGITSFWGAVIAQGRGNNSEDFVMFASANGNQNIQSSVGGDYLGVNPMEGYPQSWYMYSYVQSNGEYKRQWANEVQTHDITTGLNYDKDGDDNVRIGRTQNNNTEAALRIACIIFCQSAISDADRILFQNWIKETFNFTP
jgi:hypothetical protein